MYSITMLDPSSRTRVGVASVAKNKLGRTVNGPPDAPSCVSRAVYSFFWVQRGAETMCAGSPYESSRCFEGSRRSRRPLFALQTSSWTKDASACMPRLSACAHRFPSVLLTGRGKALAYLGSHACRTALWLDRAPVSHQLLQALHVCDCGLTLYFLLAKSASADSAWSLSWPSFRTVRRALRMTHCSVSGQASLPVQTQLLPETIWPDEDTYNARSSVKESILPNAGPTAHSSVGRALTSCCIVPEAGDIGSTASKEMAVVDGCVVKLIGDSL